MFIWVLFLAGFLGIAGLVTTLLSFSMGTAVPEPVALASLGLLLIITAWLIRYRKPRRKI